MKPVVKVGLVVAGYVGAFLAAGAVVAAHVALTNGPDRQGSSGMYAFGDSLFFLAAFGVAAILPTSAGLFFLRPYPWFWRALWGSALVIAATGLVALIDYVATRTVGRGTALGAFAVLRILISPLFATAFLLSAVFAPSRSPRIALAVATLAEAAVFGGAAFVLLSSPR
jgi:hypothetical protein